MLAKPKKAVKKTEPATTAIVPAPKPLPMPVFNKLDDSGIDDLALLIKSADIATMKQFVADVFPTFVEHKKAADKKAKNAANEAAIYSRFSSVIENKLLTSMEISSGKPTILSATNSSTGEKVVITGKESARGATEISKDADPIAMACAQFSEYIDGVMNRLGLHDTIKKEIRGAVNERLVQLLTGKGDFLVKGSVAWSKTAVKELLDSKTPLPDILENRVLETFSKSVTIEIE